MVTPSVRELLRTAVVALDGTEREGQVRMAEEVARALESGEHLLAQAGTGTGKSLAYLVPAMRLAVAERRRVVVTTATLALQRQLVERDLPRLVAALADPLGRAPSYAILKGRNNYACLQRIHDGAPDDQDAMFAPAPTTPLGRDVLRLRTWADETLTGDRDDLASGVSDRAWAQASVTSRECVGAARCRFGQECFAELARERARDADLVVTNHTLLAIDALEEVGVLPEHDAVVVDEAHELTARITSAATAELTGSMADRAARQAGRLVDPGGTDGASAVDVLARAGAGLAEVLGSAPRGRLIGLPDGLAGSVAALRDAARAVISALAEHREGSAGADPAARQQALASAGSVFDTAERVLEESPHDVAWVERGERFGPTLRVAPLGVSGLLRERLFAGRVVVLTSATLKLGGTFDVIARAVGLGPEGVARQADDEASPAEGPTGESAGESAGSSGEDAAEDTAEEASGEERGPARWRGVDVGSPFDYRRQAILYVARHLPLPGRDGIQPAVLDELAGLVEAAGGRTLGLFSSMRAAESAAEVLRPRLDVPVLCQGEDSVAGLLRQFAAEPRTCLFGTLSLWQGVDVPGAACQLVAIDRIPFPRPDDPLMSARQRAVHEAGGNGFMAVAASHAALLLAQGSGRLIRSAADRGVVAVLDPRLASARYAGFLRTSLPDYWYTTDPAQVRRSLAAIDTPVPDASVGAPAGTGVPP